MYKIGEFSKITSLTVKTLRYYEEEGILVPSMREENGYRLYSAEDAKKAAWIVFMRRFEFSIAEMKDVMDQCESEEELRQFLVEKKSMVQERIQKEKALIKEMNRYLAPNPEKEERNMQYEFELRELPAIRVISKRFHGSYQDVSKYMKALYQAAKEKPVDAPFNLYYDDSYQEDAEIEICLPVSKPILTGEYKSHELSSVKVLCTTHIGSYDTLNHAYMAIIDYAKEHKLELEVPMRERYLKGPGMIFRGNPDHYKTEIMIPCKEAQ